MDWKEDIVNHTLDNYRGRKIVLWGKYTVSDEIKEILQNKNNISNVCYIDSNESLVDNVEVFPIDYISRKNNEFYIVIPLAVHNSIKEQLSRGGRERCRLLLF